MSLPLKLEKIEGPSSMLVFLGIMLDNTKQETSLPQQKLRHGKVDQSALRVSYCNSLAS